MSRLSGRKNPGGGGKAGQHPETHQPGGKKQTRGVGGERQTRGVGE